jgi:signal transduction histidine kinase
VTAPRAYDRDRDRRARSDDVVDAGRLLPELTRAGGGARFGVVGDVVALGRSVAEAAAAGETLVRAEVAGSVSELAARAEIAAAEASWGVLAAALDAPLLVMLDPRRANETVLQLLFVLSPIRQASVWIMSATDPLHVVTHVGPAPSRRAQQVAHSTIDGAPSERERPRIHGVPLTTGGITVGALVYRAPAAEVELARLCAVSAAEALGPVVLRERMLVRSSDRERVLLESGERRLRRLALDLHDGPLQHLAGLRGEIALLRTQARNHLDSRDLDIAARLVARLDDLEARTVAADDLLRDICKSIVAPAISGKPLETTLRDEAAAFAALTSTEIDVETTGDLDELTNSARLAIVRIVQEALNNVREHSGAHLVRVLVEGTREAIRFEVVDDGCGFEPEPTMRLAAARGRLGLAGIVERARLLGGTVTLESAPGGPTRVIAMLPRWRPLSRDA